MYISWPIYRDHDQLAQSWKKLNLTGRWRKQLYYPRLINITHNWGSCSNNISKKTRTIFIFTRKAFFPVWIVASVVGNIDQSWVIKSFVADVQYYFISSRIVPTTKLLQIYWSISTFNFRLLLSTIRYFPNVSKCEQFFMRFLEYFSHKCVCTISIGVVILILLVNVLP